MNLRLPFAISSVALALALGGCAASTNEPSASAGESALAAVRLDNYMNHAKIVLIRKQVAAIDAAALTETGRVGCDFGQKKFEDVPGRIRKLVSSGGEGYGGFETTTYYDEAGKLIFGFQLTELRYEDGDESWWGRNELRVYYGENNKILLQVVRAGSATVPELIQLSEADDRAPTQNEAWSEGGLLTTPAIAFLETGCPPEGDPNGWSNPKP